MLILLATFVIAACNHSNEYAYQDSTRSYKSNYPAADGVQIPDWQITTKIKAALISDDQLSASSKFISVTTNDGVVTLTGNVPTREDSRRAEALVKGVKGVRKVDNQLTINP